MGQHKNWPHFSLQHFPYDDDGMSCMYVGPSFLPHNPLSRIGRQWWLWVAIEWEEYIYGEWIPRLMLRFLFYYYCWCCFWGWCEFTTRSQNYSHSTTATTSRVLLFLHCFHFSLAHNYSPIFIKALVLASPKAQLCTTPTVSHFQR